MGFLRSRENAITASAHSKGVSPVSTGSKSCSDVARRCLDAVPKDRGHGRLAVSYISRLEWGDNRYLDVSVFPGRPIDLA